MRGAARRYRYGISPASPSNLSARAKNSTVLKSSIRKGWRTGFWARATCWRSLNRRNAASTTRRRNSGFAKSKKGGMAALLEKLPAQFQPASGQSNLDQAEKQMRRMSGIIHSMTAAERTQPELIKASRKRRIAAGAGVHVQEVNRLLAQFEQMRTMTKKLKGGNLARMTRGGFGGLAGMR